MTDEFTSERPQRRRHFTDASLDGWAEFKPGKRRKLVPRPDKIGHFVVVQPSGVRSWAIQARDPVSRKQVWKTLDRCDQMSAEEAAVEGDRAIKRIRQGLPPVEPPPPTPETLSAVFAQWFKLEVEGKQRTANETQRCYQKYVRERLGDASFRELRRSDLNRLLDAIVADHGSRQADVVGGILKRMQRWHADRADYAPTFIGVRRRHHNKSRERILSHDELRILWHAAELPEAQPFGAFLRLSLLLCQRKAPLMKMRRSDILDGVVIETVENGRIVRETYDHVWRIPQAPREKDAGGDLPLPPVAWKIIAAQPRLTGNDYVFASRRLARGPINGIGASKEFFDRRFLPSGFAYRVHDLRRSARSLMSAAGVDRDIAERVLGHRIGAKTEQTYDRHAYVREKAEALQKLADLVATILKGPGEPADVVDLDAHRAASRG
jgi:integrase